MKPVVKRKRRKRRHAQDAFRARQPVGTPPGQIRSDPTAPKPRLRLIRYDAEHVEEVELQDLSEFTALKARSLSVTWINVDGVGHAETFRQLGEVFNLHPLALEDAVNVHQRPKVDDYGKMTYIALRMPEIIENQLVLEQMSLFVGADYVITVQEQPGDCLDRLRERIRQGRGFIRQHGADYLAYALLDGIIDSYFPVLEHYSNRLEEMEEDVIQRVGGHQPSRIHAIRHDLHTIRHVLWPTREAVAALGRGDGTIVRAETRLFLRDCHDHIVQLLDVADTCRDLASGLMDLHLSGLNARMNEIVKVLTMISTVFIPLSFIAGIYGMNFDPQRSPWNMPELTWRYGYLFALLLMALTTGGLVLYFKRKGWLWGTDEGR